MTKSREPVDMSPEAIAARLETMRELYRAWQKLKRFQLVGAVTAASTEPPRHGS